MKPSLRAGIVQIREGIRLGRAIRHPPVPSPASFPATIRQRLGERQERLLWMLENPVFRDPRSPYRPLFETAGYGWSRVRTLVQAAGCEAALRRLSADGIYLDVREFKGLKPVHRFGRTFVFRENDFINRSAVAAVHSQSSASRSHWTRSTVSIEDLCVHAGFGIVGYACLNPAEPDEVHLLSDIICAIQRRAPVETGDAEVPAYSFTTLLPSARRIMMNVGMGDYGAMAGRPCGCPLEHAGLTTHLWGIRSFEKLTAEGITYLGSAAITLIKEVLPRAFGGEATDYQLVEVEDDEGFTRLFLFASPRLGFLDEEALRAAALEVFAANHAHPGYGAKVADTWARAGTLRIVRREPLATVTGKIHHLRRPKTAVREVARV